MSDKPPYQVPTMSEIAELPWNGINVISTFSGCGGSSLGYRMASCKVLGASEFVPAAYETYRANSSSTHLWTDDIREMTGEQMLADVGLSVGELDILDGSPPCSSFSTAGKRSNGWGQVSRYSDTKQRTDDLFFEFARILAEMQPRAFVAENVSGLVKGVAKGYFKVIHRALGDAGYRVAASVLDASLLGVPQARQRLIFIGMRNDLGLEPRHPKPLPYRYTLADAIGAKPVVRRTFSGGRLAADEPMATVTTDEHDFWTAGEPSHDPETGKRLTRDWSDETRAKIERSFVDDETNQNIGIGRYAIGPEWQKLREGQTSSRYFQLTRPHHDRPCPTVTARGDSIDIAGVTHPSEPRKFTLAELRRICSFPDDFALLGTYEQRWERLGRAVPPVMMSHIATAVVRTLRGEQ